MTQRDGIVGGVGGRPKREDIYIYNIIYIYIYIFYRYI